MNEPGRGHSVPSGSRRWLQQQKNRQSPGDVGDRAPVHGAWWSARGRFRPAPAQSWTQPRDVVTSRNLGSLQWTHVHPPSAPGPLDREQDRRARDCVLGPLANCDRRVTWELSGSSSPPRTPVGTQPPLSTPAGPEQREDQPEQQGG